MLEEVSYHNHSCNNSIVLWQKWSQWEAHIIEEHHCQQNITTTTPIFSNNDTSTKPIKSSLASQNPASNILVSFRKGIHWWWWQHRQQKTCKNVERGITRMGYSVWCIHCQGNRFIWTWTSVGNCFLTPLSPVLICVSLHSLSFFKLHVFNLIERYSDSDSYDRTSAVVMVARQQQQQQQEATATSATTVTQ